MNGYHDDRRQRPGPSHGQHPGSYHDPYDRGDHRQPDYRDPRAGRPDDIYDDTRDDNTYATRIPPAAPANRGGGGGRYRPEDDIYSRPHKDRYNGVGGPGPSPREDYHGRGHSEPEMPDLPRHDLDHLATFTVGPKQGLLSPEDGIRKLRQMELSTGVWTMRVQLLVDPSDIIIIDGYTKEEMERFSLSLITEPTAVTNEDRRDVYNNILLFTVREDPHRRAPTEMHIFQVISKPAQDAVDDIKAAKAGKFSQVAHGHNDRYHDPRHNRVEEYEPHSKHNADIMDRYPTGPHVNEMKSRYREKDVDNASILSENTDRNVQNSRRRDPSADGDGPPAMSLENCQQLLNHCFDDIEKFVGRLQQAADAFKELDRRRRGRNQHNRAQGDGMLTVRARPPPAKDFVETFQKFKLSFNLLARLKPHIHDPNAPELVHFLFTPLSLVVEASKDPHHGRPDLAAKVIAPLLTPDARDLLNNCLSSKEADLWKSLGEPWVMTRDEWKGYVPPYYPRFYDGWQCPESWLGDINGGEVPRGSFNDSRGSHDGRGPPRDYAHESSHGGYSDPRPDDRANGPSPKTKEEMHRNAMDEYERELARRGRLAEPNSIERSRDQRDPWEADSREREQREQERRAQDAREREERAKEQERRELQREIDRQRERERRRLEEESRPPPRAPPASSPEDKQERWMRDAQARGAKLWEVIHAREGRNPKELTVAKGDLVEVVDDSKNWWKVQNSSGNSGFTPYTILQKLK